MGTEGRAPRVLLLHGGGRRSGLCRHLFEVARRALEARGAELRATDLLEDGFDPVLRLEEGQRHATACDPDREPLVARYQEDVRWADRLVIVHPVWWFAPPAILKGWVDRVLVDGVALEQREGEPPRGLLAGRRMLVVQTFNTNRAVARLAFGGAAGAFWKRIVGLPVGIERTKRLALYSVEALDEHRLRRFEQRVARALGALLP